MANTSAQSLPFRCVAPGHRYVSVITMDIMVGWCLEWAVDPTDAEYREVHLCRWCANDARQAGVHTVELAEARKIIRQHEKDMERAAFFRQFVRAPQEENQAMSA